MSTEKLIHDIPFVVEAARRNNQPKAAPAGEKQMIEDEMHPLARRVGVRAEPSQVSARVRKLVISNG